MKLFDGLHFVTVTLCKNFSPTSLWWNRLIIQAYSCRCITKSGQIETCLSWCIITNFLLPSIIVWFPRSLFHRLRSKMIWYKSIKLIERKKRRFCNLPPRKKKKKKKKKKTLKFSYLMMTTFGKFCIFFLQRSHEFVFSCAVASKTSALYNKMLYTDPFWMRMPHALLLFESFFFFFFFFFFLRKNYWFLSDYNLWATSYATQIEIENSKSRF